MNQVEYDGSTLDIIGDAPSGNGHESLTKIKLLKSF
jgi:hypothetical protein